MRFRSLLLLLLLSTASTLQARIISYAPYSDRPAVPAVQSRLNRHFVLIEQGAATSVNTTVPPPPVGLPPVAATPLAQLVLYDSKGQEEPKVIFPQDGSSTPIGVVAVREDARQVPTILVQTNFNFEGTNATQTPIWIMSTDGGTTWKKLGLPAISVQVSGAADTGLPFVRARYSNVRVGTSDVPFVVAIPNPTVVTLFGVVADGSIRTLTTSNVGGSNVILGSDREGRRFLVRNSQTVNTIDNTGAPLASATLSLNGVAEGWITPDGNAFLENTVTQGNVVLYFIKNQVPTRIDASWDGDPNFTPSISSAWVFFAVPTTDFSSAWIMKRGGSRPTRLLLHNGQTETEQWSDISAPEVEALHPAASGTKLLIQVHRPRLSSDQLQFKDPALAVWKIGDPAPRFFDELFLSETATKAFVHVDVDKIESGDQFVFDSGVPLSFTPIPGPILSPAPPSGGGSDVVQEWGVVRASLQQRLVLPGVGRTPGAFGSFWVTDVTFYNPADTATTVAVRFTPVGDAPRASDILDRTLTLEAKEIRTVPDALQSMFGMDSGNGAFFITPQNGAAINVTSRTYTRAPGGSYGFGMNGIDIYAAASPRFPVTFSGAFQGSDYRTNFVLTDASGRGTEARLNAADIDGAMGNDVTVFTAPAFGMQQINFLGGWLGVSSGETGALFVRPTRGDAIASVFVIDNRTNDPTFFPPDLPASVLRTIPAIGHLDGANGSKFRSDLYLYNVSSVAKTLTLQAKAWDVNEGPTIVNLTLLPNEARVIKDVLAKVFNKTGIARLRFTLQGSQNDTSVRVTSRTYTIDPNGGTYGFLLPPLNSFQSGSAGDTLEILGASLDSRFRTNLGLVDLTAFPGPRAARARVDIIDDRGKSLDSFETSFPSAGGTQLNDLFRARGLADSPRPVLIRVSPIEGMIGAYAAYIDNGTNDPAYFAANLASH